MVQLNRTQKSYLRGAIWLAALAVVVVLPKPGEAEATDAAGKAAMAPAPAPVTAGWQPSAR